jgi:polygalacturonase
MNVMKKLFLVFLLSSVALRPAMGIDATSYVTTATGTPTARTLGTRSADLQYVKNFGAVDDGTTDNATIINNAIAGMTSGRIVVSGGVFAIGSTINLKAEVVLALEPGAVIKWIGPSGGTMFATPSSTATWYTGVVGGPGSVIDPNGTAGIVFNLHSAQNSEFGGYNFGNGSGSTVGFQILGDQGNSGFNYFHDIVAWVIGTMFSLQGSTGVVTLNSFERISANYVYGRGVDFIQWADNNWFRDIRINLSGSGSSGVVFNSGSPTTDVGIYANTFTNLAIDTFGTIGNRSGVVLNNSKQIHISNYYQAPTAENGSVVDNYGNSYWIMQIGIQNSYNMKVWSKNVVQ